jgi:hypothetical protein
MAAGLALAAAGAATVRAQPVPDPSWDSSGAGPSADQTPPYSIGFVPDSGGYAPAPDDGAYAAAPLPPDYAQTLSPYGAWVYVSGLGRVWRPAPWAAGPGFRPYASGGRWRWTDAGWYFDSDWPWGGIVFHYGRWWADPVQGWVWVPGSTWAPAWVDWRWGGGYVGWEPLPPPGLAFSVSVGFGFDPWCFVPQDALLAPALVPVLVSPVRVRQVFAVTAPVRRVGYVRGGGRFNPGPPAERVFARPVPAVPVTRLSPRVSAGFAQRADRVRPGVSAAAPVARATPGTPVSPGVRRPGFAARSAPVAPRPVAPQVASPAPRVAVPVPHVAGAAPRTAARAPQAAAPATRAAAPAGRTPHRER